MVACTHVWERGSTLHPRKPWPASLLHSRNVVLDYSTNNFTVQECKIMLIYRSLLKSFSCLSELFHRCIRAETDISSLFSFNLTFRFDLTLAWQAFELTSAWQTFELTWAWQAWGRILPMLEPEMRGCRLRLFHLPHKPRCRVRLVNVFKVWLNGKNIQAGES